MTDDVKILDSVLHEIDDFGKYQKINFLLICFAAIYDAAQFSFVFTAKDMDYRCRIDSCDNDTSVFLPPWLHDAVPFKNGEPARCERFLQLPNVTSCSLFDSSKTETCDNFVFDDQPATIVNDFKIYCEDNIWKLSLIGTINSIGHFIGLPIVGFVSDKFGRRTALMLSIAVSSVMGFIRSFAPSYAWFIVFEVLDAIGGAGVFTSAFILVIELVGASKHALVSTLLSSCFVLGEVLLSLVAWKTNSWRTFLRIIYPVGLLLLSYIWVIPESVRWLLAKGKSTEAIAILRKAAKTNGKEISSSSLEKMFIEAETVARPQANNSCFEIFGSVTLTIRLLTASFCWITCTFLYYGLSLNSVALSGNSYLNFILTALAEIPAYITYYFAMDRIGRKTTLASFYFFTGIACISFAFIPQDKTWLKLTVYVLGKLGVTVAFSVMYIFTTEIFPTTHRHSLFATCSMIGRTGSMLAPQSPLLALFWSDLPIVSFGALSLCAGLLSLTFPETTNLELPDTIEEAELLGKSRKASQIT